MFSLLTDIARDQELDQLKRQVEHLTEVVTMLVNQRVEDGKSIQSQVASTKPNIKAGNGDSC